MRLSLTAAVVAVGLCLLFAGVATADVTTAHHATYALRPCSTCKEIRYSTEQECRDAAFAKAAEVGQTRTTGAAVYTCITRFNVIATFKPNPPPREATLSWTPPTQNTDGTALSNLAGYRIHYGLAPGELTQTIQLANPGLSSYTISNLLPGTYYFAVRAYSSAGTESDPSDVVSKAVL